MRLNGGRKKQCESRLRSARRHKTLIARAAPHLLRSTGGDSPLEGDSLYASASPVLSIADRPASMSAKYERAPIAEAVIDIRVDASPEASAAIFKEMLTELSDRFENTTPIQNFQMGVEQDASQNATFHAAQAVIGYRLQNSDASRVLQIKIDGFTYSWLAPYASWEDFRKEAYELWKRFDATIGYRQTSRIAIRTINRIIIDDPRPIELAKYFRLLPTIPDPLGNDADTFFLQLQIRMNECTPGARAIINFAGSEANSGVPADLVLDLDVYVDEIAGMGEEEIWRKLDGLRVCKNTLFESCITDELRSKIS